MKEILILPKKIWNIFFLISHSIDFISQGPVIFFRNSDLILSAIYWNRYLRNLLKITIQCTVIEPSYDSVYIYILHIILFFSRVEKHENCPNDIFNLTAKLLLKSNWTFVKIEFLPLFSYLRKSADRGRRLIRYLFPRSTNCCAPSGQTRK